MFSLDVVLDPTKDDIVARCLELTNKKGVDVTFDAAGVQPGLDQAVNSLKARGTHVNIAIWEKRYMTSSTMAKRRDDMADVLKMLSVAQ